MAIRSILPPQVGVDKTQTWATVGPPDEKSAVRVAFTKEASPVVIEAAEAMASVTSNLVTLKVYHDRRGWQIHGTLAVEDPQLKQLLLSVAKERLLLQCQQSKHVRVLNHCTNPWRETHHGFRSLLSLVDEEHEACMPMYECGRCPNGTGCPKKHPVCVKRLYVALHMHEPVQDVDLEASEIW